jgi:cytochrome c-type biogenesis protein CcmH
MREVIAQKLTAGESKDEIKSYFVQQYGDVVLGMPANEGFNRLVWILPILAGLVALAWLAYMVHLWTRRRPAAAAVIPRDRAERARSSGDDYLRRVDEELGRYE